MSISNASKNVLNPELDRLRAEKQRLSNLIDDAQLKIDELKAQKVSVQSRIDAIKADIDAL